MDARYKKYVVATSFIIAAAIFAAGIILGVFLDRYKVNDVINSIRESELNTESYMVEQQLTESFGQHNCVFLKPRLIDMSRQLSEIGHKLTLYESGALSLKQDDYEYLKRRYFVIEARIYMYEIQMKQVCKDDRAIILFFYRGGDDAGSIRQGYALDEIYKEYRDNISTHSFDIDFKNSTITDLLEKYYNITDIPTIIVNNEIKKTGFVSVGELTQMVKASSQKSSSNSTSNSTFSNITEVLDNTSY